MPKGEKTPKRGRITIVQISECTFQAPTADGKIMNLKVVSRLEETTGGRFFCRTVVTVDDVVKEDRVSPAITFNKKEGFTYGAQTE